MNPGFYNRDISSYTPGRTYIDLCWTSAAAGALTNGLTTSAGIADVSHDGTGVFTVTFSEPPLFLTNLVESIEQASYSKAGACKVRVTDHDFDAKTVELTIVDGDGDAVDPTTNDVVRCTFVFRRVAV